MFIFCRCTLHVCSYWATAEWMKLTVVLRIPLSLHVWTAEHSEVVELRWHFGLVLFRTRSEHILLSTVKFIQFTFFFLFCFESFFHCPLQLEVVVLVCYLILSNCPFACTLKELLVLKHCFDTLMTWCGSSCSIDVFCQLDFELWAQIVCSSIT